MTEADAVERTDEPVTVDRIADDLRALGVEAGGTVLVHSSLSSLGWVAGGPPAVVDALMEAVTAKGTLVMPTHSTQYTDPAGWEAPAVPEAWVDVIERTRPPYRPAVTPTRGMGSVPECFRCYPGVVRSRHPTYSFAAWGADAGPIVVDHPYDHGMGEGSPLAEIYDRDGTVLTLGTDHDTNTSLHFAEHRADREQDVSTETAPVLDEDGERVMISFEQLEYDATDFAELGREFEDDHPGAVTRGRVGFGDAKLVPQRAVVDYGAEWFEANRE